MTEKRFERIYGDVDVFCRDHNAKGLSQLIEKEDYDTIVDLLNDLSNENEQLKQQVAFLDEFIKTGVQYEYYQKIYDENEQLKSEKEHYKKQVDELDGLLNKYEITFEELEEILGNDYRERF